MYKKLQDEAIARLTAHLFDPGRFSVLVLGARGTGKTYWIKRLQEENKKSRKHKCLTALQEINSSLAEDNEHYWQKKLREAQKGILVINDVECLAPKSQDLLFEAMSTTDGKYGFGVKDIECRIVFTSTKDITVLRDNEEKLMHKFFDRISQLIVTFPSFKFDPKGIQIFIKETWGKMKFKGKAPGEELGNWICANLKSIHGNFRDLDKLVINWNSYRLMNLDESEILEKVTEEFLKYYHSPEPSKGLHDTLTFTREKDYDQLLSDFRKKLKEWAKNEHDGSIKQAAKSLGVSHRTMERW